MRAVYDLLLSNAFDPSMVLQNHNIVVARSTLTPNNSSQNFISHSHQGGQPGGGGGGGGSGSGSGGRYPVNAGPGNQRPIVDLLVAMVAVPVLILCALQLEKNLHDMHNSPESRWLVFALGIGMLVISVIICGYVTHRMGVCIWAGPIDEAGNRAGSGALHHINSQNDVLRIVDSLPPSYESVVKCELPPPAYDCVMIDVDPCKDMQPQTSSKDARAAQASGSGSISVSVNMPNATLHI
ncbi:PREDICTED: uncharacterized protein LOC108618962 isoform X2 [Drosophila arizonae]|uniref:Uncharacterized protein LOC108618962 isoform X1 n=1 Tax=Drosophila arizonae TaxID=7263 RepID=A0ABM1PU02_DROAR|nr:PREDICTED: uncharacterized protein LOC108618962 isoform X1 [Drosophila arizonae]XP_017870689.1 PREDICTED: uncharacterized protein LOC108618962 isoform X2 [Drosophila arizonae]